MTIAHFAIKISATVPFFVHRCGCSYCIYHLETLLNTHKMIHFGFVLYPDSPQRRNPASAIRTTGSPGSQRNGNSALSNIRVLFVSDFDSEPSKLSRSSPQTFFLHILNEDTCVKIALVVVVLVLVLVLMLVIVLVLLVIVLVLVLVLVVVVLVLLLVVVVVVLVRLDLVL